VPADWYVATPKQRDACAHRSKTNGDSFVTPTAFADSAVVFPRAAFAQSDEIQVYDGGLAPPGIFNLTWDNNFTPKGIATGPYPGAVVADQHAEMRTFFYGVNFELSINEHRWDDHSYTSEVRPIIGWHFGQWDVIVNPIVDTAYDGWESLEFVPAERVAYNFKSGWTLSAEEYGDYGPLNGFYSAGEQAHQLYGVVNKTFGSIEIEAGAGFGLTNASDRCTLKLLVIHDLNKKPIRFKQRGRP
jgi:hypothetical protein